jgi:DNA-binding NarL/FixJ family response regulator
LSAQRRATVGIVRVVLAEDNLLVREGLVGLLKLEPDIDVVAQCASYDELLAAVDQHLPNVVLTDIRMPPGHSDEGVRAACLLRETHPDLGVLVLSQYDAPDYALRVFADGVAGRGYLLKDHVGEPDELIMALRQVAAGGSSIDPAIIEVMLGARARRRDSPLARLTPREREVLAHMAAGRNNTAIAGQLFLSVRAVERHINSIFSKLGLVDEADYHRRVRAVLLFLSEE